MRNLKNTICNGLPNFCSAGKQARAVSSEEATKLSSTIPQSKLSDSKKPWSIFGDLYWV